MKSASAYRKELAAHGVFYTDPKLAEAIKSHVPSDITEVYDPTCGEGNLLSVFPDAVKKYGQELDEDSARHAQDHLANAVIVAGDTLKIPAFMDRKFDAIVANYPFSVAWEPDAEDPRFSDAPALAPKSKADMAFILHILYMLSDTGTAAVLCSPGVGFREAAEGKIRRWLLEQNVIDSVTLYEGGYFEDTKIQTVLIVFKKHRASQTIRFVNHEHSITADIPRSQVMEDCRLTVSKYAAPPYKPEEKTGPTLRELQESMYQHQSEAFVKECELSYSLIAGIESEDKSDMWQYNRFLEHLHFCIETANEWIIKIENWVKHRENT